MTEYWVSRPKHHCKYCNCWIQGDKVSIQHHESGARHKNATQLFFKKSRDDKFNKSHEERELQKQLQQIEEDARRRFESDISGGHTSLFNRTPPPPPPRHSVEEPGIPLQQQNYPPPPPRRFKEQEEPDIHLQQQQQSYPPPPPPPRRLNKDPEQDQEQEQEQEQKDNHLQQKKQESYPPPPPPRVGSSIPELETSNSSSSSNIPNNDVVNGNSLQLNDTPNLDQDDGVYTVREINYVDCKSHPDLLIPGSLCEYWSETREDWLEATIVSALESSDLNSSQFVISHQDPETLQDLQATVMLENIRIKLFPGMTLKQLKERREAVNVANVINENTGYSEWSTVSVRVYDEEEEAKRIEEEERKQEIEMSKKATEKIHFLDDHEGDDASASFNPWGGSYKGIVLSDSATLHDKVSSMDDDQLNDKPIVSFKKKKTKTQPKSSKKRGRTIDQLEENEDDDDDDF